jgi:isopenicillin N synthase-like dioxygenase
MQKTPEIWRRTVPSRRRRDGLIRSAADTTSQGGEDGILAHLFEILPKSSHGEQKTRWCVDVGAWDGKHLSNTHSLLNNNGRGPWRGILIEADTERFQALSLLYANSNNICLNQNICAAGDADAPNNLRNILKAHQASFLELPDDFDFLCIDIDGMDYWVLSDLWNESQFRPNVVCIEFNPTIPDDVVYIPPRNDGIRHGASLAALVELASKCGYVLVETTLFNAFFVPKTIYNAYLSTEVPDTSIEALHECTMGTSLYQLYDGTLMLSGCKRMLWHRLPLDEAKLQILPESERTFPFAPSEIENDDQDSLFDYSQVIDLKPYCSNNARCTVEELQECSILLCRNLMQNGFCLIRGTGMDPITCREALRATSSFLQDADEDVRRSCLAQDRARRGYSPMNAENFAALIGEQGPNDLVRKFRVGPEIASDATSDGSTNSLLQPNIWPSAPVWDGDSAHRFRSAVEKYYMDACVVAQRVVQTICDGLTLHNPDLESRLNPLRKRTNGDTAHIGEHTTSILTLLGYRAGTRHKGKSKGPLVAAHTDVGVITMLLFDGRKTCATLQRRHDGGWADVDLPAKVPEDPIFVVNVADCLSDLCQGTLPSTVHRVVANRNSRAPRNCCALFVGLEPSCQLQLGGEHLAYEEWRKRRIAKAKAVLEQK